MKVSNYLSGAVRQFSYWFVHGILGYPILEGFPKYEKFADIYAVKEYIEQAFIKNEIK